jgi:GDP-fucose transporter C1
VEGSALSMSWYSNLLSSVVLLPFIIISGEGPAVLDILSGRAEGLKTFLVGSMITVSLVWLFERPYLKVLFCTNPVLRALSGFCSLSLLPYRFRSRLR